MLSHIRGMEGRFTPGEQGWATHMNSLCPWLRDAGNVSQIMCLSVGVHALTVACKRILAVCTVWVASLVATSVFFNQYPDWKKKVSTLLGNCAMLSLPCACC
jgi:hypothetical protein